MKTYVCTHVHNPTKGDIIYQWAKPGLYVAAGRTVAVDHDPMSAGNDPARQLLSNDLAESRVELYYEFLDGQGVATWGRRSQARLAATEAPPAQPPAPAPVAPDRPKGRPPVEPIEQRKGPKNPFADAIVEGRAADRKPPITPVFGEEWEKRGMNSLRRDQVEAVDMFGQPFKAEEQGKR